MAVPFVRACSINHPVVRVTRASGNSRAGSGLKSPPRALPLPLSHRVRRRIARPSPTSSPRTA